MKTTVGLCCIATLFLLTTASVDNSNDTSSITKPRIKREPATIIHVNRPPRPKKSYGASSRSKYGPISHSYGTIVHGGYGPTKSGYGPSKPKYGPSKYGPSKPGYGPKKPKYGPQKQHGFKPSSYRPPKYGSSFYGPESEEEDYGFGEPPQSFGEPPTSTFSQSLGFSGTGLSSYGSSFDDLSSEYESSSYSSPHKTYKRPSKKPYDFGNDFKSGYEDEDSFDSFGYNGEPSYSYEPTRIVKTKRPKYKSPNQSPNKYYGKQTYSTQSLTFNKPKGYSSPFDTSDNYEGQGTGYPDESIPVSDYFGAPLTYSGSSSNKYESYNDDIDDSYRGPSGPGYRRPEAEDDILLRDRPKRKPKIVKVVKVRSNRKKPKTRQTDEGQIIMGGHYSESSRIGKNPTGYSDMYDSTFAGSNTAYVAVPPDTNYINYKSANMGFSPQNVNDVFTANKRLEAGYEIDLGDSIGVQSQMGNIVARAPNHPYNTDHASEIKITKSLSHDYYAGTAPDPFYTSTHSPTNDDKNYRSNYDNILPPNYFDFADTSLSEKTSQKFRDIASISLRSEDNKADIKSNYDENIRNHRT